MPRLRSFLFSIQTKLVLAMTAVIVLAILLAGTVFVARSRNERKDAALNRIVAASPAIYNTAIYYSAHQNAATFYSTLDKLSQQQNVRILLLSTDNTVLHDTGHQIDGKQIAIPASRFDDRRGYVSWESRESMGSSTTLITASSFLSDDNELPFRIAVRGRGDTRIDPRAIIARGRISRGFALSTKLP